MRKVQQSVNITDDFLLLKSLLKDGTVQTWHIISFTFFTDKSLLTITVSQTSPADSQKQPQF